eukprot:355048-Chlamydomonas_euryale.AAC.6
MAAAGPAAGAPAAASAGAAALVSAHSGLDGGDKVASYTNIVEPPAPNNPSDPVVAAWQAQGDAERYAPQRHPGTLACVLGSRVECVVRERMYSRCWVDPRSMHQPQSARPTLFLL